MADKEDVQAQFERIDTSGNGALDTMFAEALVNWEGLCKACDKPARSSWSLGSVVG